MHVIKTQKKTEDVKNKYIAALQLFFEEVFCQNII